MEGVLRNQKFLVNFQGLIQVFFNALVDYHFTFRLAVKLCVYMRHRITVYSSLFLPLRYWFIGFGKINFWFFIIFLRFFCILCNLICQCCLFKFRNSCRLLLRLASFLDLFSTVAQLFRATIYLLHEKVSTVFEHSSNLSKHKW